MAVASAFSVSVPTAITPRIGYAVGERIALEAAGDIAFETSDVAWGIGSLGLRITPLGSPDKTNLHLFDVEAGGGLGKGGFLYGYQEDECTDESFDPHIIPPCIDGLEPDGLSPMERLAGGGYLGLGYGYRWRITSVYLRARYQLTFAKNIPTSNWFTGLLGLEARLGKITRFYLGLGVEGYVNRGMYMFFPSGQIGLSVVFDIRTDSDFDMDAAVERGV